MLAGHLSTTEIEYHKNAVVLIPIGACEQHGPHLPLLTDTLIAEEICKRVEQKSLERVLLYPAIWFGDSVEHTGFTGTLSINLQTLIQMLEQLFSWLDQSGFTRCILYNGHGGNVHAAAAIAEEFSRTHQLKVQSLYAYTPLVRKQAKILFGVSESHAGSSETSLLYALRPDLIKTSEKTITNPQPYSGGGRLALYTTKKLAENGILEAADQITIDIAKGATLATCMQAELEQALK